MKYLLALPMIALLALSSPSFANGNDDDEGCQGNCPQGGDVNVDVDVIDVDVTKQLNLNQIRNNVENEVDIDNENKNFNTNFNANYAGGGDAESESNSNATADANADSNSVSNSNATGGNAEATGGNATAQGGQGGEGGNAESNNAVSTTLNFDRAASTAYAPALQASAGTCMGSTSAGGQGLNFGLSLGTTWTDHDCNRRRFASMLMALGENEAAIQLLCKNDEVREVLDSCQ